MQSKSSNTPSPLERRLSVVLLSLLVLIAAGVLALQSNYDPSQWRRQALVTGESDVDTAADASPSVPDSTIAGVTPLSPAETYDAENLSDKINGKAELYLGAGFQSLNSRRFALIGQPGQWMERFIYDMGHIRGAFAVFSAQRRSTIQPLELTPHAYLASNGLFLVHGRYYVEIIAAQVSPDLQNGMQALARNFVAMHQAGSRTLEALARFPERHRVPHSRGLIANSAFGLDRLDWIFTARYAADAAEATAFLSRRHTAEEAAALADAFVRYWLDYGGEVLQSPVAPAQARLVTILDSFEIVFTHGPYLIGVHEATTLEFGLEVADQLGRSIAEDGP
jgi:hypothetical protein